MECVSVWEGGREWKERRDGLFIYCHRRPSSRSQLTTLPQATAVFLDAVLIDLELEGYGTERRVS